MAAFQTQRARWPPAEGSGSRGPVHLSTETLAQNIPPFAPPIRTQMERLLSLPSFAGASRLDDRRYSLSPPPTRVSVRPHRGGSAVDAIITSLLVGAFSILGQMFFDHSIRLGGSSRIGLPFAEEFFEAPQYHLSPYGSYVTTLGNLLLRSCQPLQTDECGRKLKNRWRSPKTAEIRAPPRTTGTVTRS
jgi:hypothetical protein